MECKYCKKILSSKSSLNLHQKRTKYCLKIQGKNVKSDLACEYCDQNFTYKSALQAHYKTCKVNKPYVRNMLIKCNEYKVENKELKKRIILLEKDKLDIQDRYDKLAEMLANRSTTTNHNTVNNLSLSVFDKTQEDISRLVDENYNKDYLIDGQKGVARFTNLHVLKSSDSKKPPIYVITDKSRGNGKYKVSETETVSDIGMNGLTNKVHPSIKKKAINIAANENSLEDEKLFEGYQEVFNMQDDNGIFRRELSKILETGYGALI